MIAKKPLIITDAHKVFELDGGAIEAKLEFKWPNSYDNTSEGNPFDTAVEVEAIYHVCDRFMDEKIRPLLTQALKANEAHATATWLVSENDFAEDSELLPKDVEMNLKEMWFEFTAGKGSGIDTEKNRKDKPKTPFYEVENKYIDPDYIKILIKGY